MYDFLFITPKREEVKPRILPPIAEPPFVKKITFTKKELDIFNQNPAENYKEIISVLGEDPIPENIATLLYFSNLTDHAITKLLFSKGEIIQVEIFMT